MRVLKKNCGLAIIFFVLFLSSQNVFAKDYTCSKTVYVKENFYLKDLNIYGKFKIKKIDKNIISVSKKGKVTGKKPGKTYLMVRNNGNLYKIKVNVKKTVTYKKSKNKIFFELRNWYTGDIWNNFVDIQFYKTYGTSCTGGELDVDFTYRKLKKKYKLKKQYDIYINSLGKKDKEIKYAWNLMSEETENKYNYLKKNGVDYTGECDFSLDILSDYYEYFRELTDKYLYN